MRTPRIYHDAKLTKDTDYQLSQDASQHLCKVLRLNVNDPLVLFDGNGTQIRAKISAITGKQVTAHTLDAAELSATPKVRIHLGLAISKGDRMDYAIQKAVEAGVNEITPWLGERTVVKLDEQRAAKRNDHWQAIILNACEQCGQNYLPVLRPVTSFNEWIRLNTTDLKLFFDVTATQTLHTLTAQPSVRITIGPEGGLSADEINGLSANGFCGVRLGPRILRTETAAVSACVALQTLWGDYKD